MVSWIEKALRSIGLLIKATVIALVGLKLVVVQYFRNIIKAACGSFKFIRYYRKAVTATGVGIQGGQICVDL